MAGARRITTAHVLHLMILLLLPTFLCRPELARERVRANIRGVLPFDLSLFRSLDRLGIERQGDCGGAEERRARGHPLLCFMSTGVNVVWSLRT